MVRRLAVLADIAARKLDAGERAVAVKLHYKGWGGSKWDSWYAVPTEAALREQIAHGTNTIAPLHMHTEVARKPVGLQIVAPATFKSSMRIFYRNICARKFDES